MLPGDPLVLLEFLVGNLPFKANEKNRVGQIESERVRHFEKISF